MKDGKNKRMEFLEHSFNKINLVTQFSKKWGSYDSYRCANCGAEGKRFGLSQFVTAGKFKKPCKIFEPSYNGKIEITQCNAFGKQFANLTKGSIHVVIPAPEIYKDDDRGVWVMGVGEPVKVLNEEYTIIKPMKDLKERILEIIKKWESCPFAGHSFLSAIDGNNYPKLAYEIEALIKENYVEKEFMNWLLFNAADCRDQAWNIGNGVKYSTNEIYTYWLDHTELHKDK